MKEIIKTERIVVFCSVICHYFACHFQAPINLNANIGISIGELYPASINHNVNLGMSMEEPYPSQ